MVHITTFSDLIHVRFDAAQLRVNYMIKALADRGIEDKVSCSVPREVE